MLSNLIPLALLVTAIVLKSAPLTSVALVVYMLLALVLLFGSGIVLICVVAIHHGYGKQNKEARLSIVKAFLKPKQPIRHFGTVCTFVAVPLLAYAGLPVAAFFWGACWLVGWLMFSIAKAIAREWPEWEQG